MAEAYLAHGMGDEATFSLFVRKLPSARNYLLACGIDETLALIEELRFDAEELSYLRSLRLFSERFLDWLAHYRFGGMIRAVAEGAPLFPNEPILEVTAPIAEAQILETLILNQIHAQTIWASKASRVVTAAAGRRVVDFGSRRAQGAEAALTGARAFHVAGVDATSNILAGAYYGIPVAGTMAHSFVEACDSELDAFRRFVKVFPDTTLLVDTYDTLEGVRRVVALARELGGDFNVRGVRLDSGDLAALAQGARAILDEAGLHAVQVFASGGLDELKIAALMGAGAPIDAFGVGTDMSVSADAPALDIAYKLTEYAGQGRLKLSSGKRTLPGRKQVFRQPDGDVIGLIDEQLPGEGLLCEVMRAGERVAPPRALSEIRAFAARERAKLDSALRALAPARQPRAVAVSAALSSHERSVTNVVRARG